MTGLKQLLSARENAVITQSESISGPIPDPGGTAPDYLWLEHPDSDWDALAGCRQLTQAFPGMKVIIFYDSKDPKTIKGFIQAGIAAYLLPSCTVGIIEEALRGMQAHTVYIDPRIRQHLADYLLDVNEKKNNGGALTRREKEVLRLIVEENTTQEIASKLYISSCTVETHRLHLIQKMGVKNTAGLVREALVRQLYAYP
ncbi:hypothetical protein GCM10009415_48100 [Chitinophaga japonensis]